MEYLDLIDRQLKDAHELWEEAEKKEREAKAKYELLLNQREMFLYTYQPKGESENGTEQ
jgi:hypothetical protein